MTSEADGLRTPLSVLHAFCCDVLQTVGVPADDAALVADSLTQADIRGLSSHGAVRLLPVYVRRLQAGSTRAAPRVCLVRQRGSLALVDGDAGLGQVVAIEPWRSRSTRRVSSAWVLWACATAPTLARAPSSWSRRWGLV